MLRTVLALAVLVLPLTAHAAKGTLPAPGEYLCKIAKEYKLRPCTVAADGDTVRLTIPEGLFGVEGTLHEDEGVVFFDGRLSEPRSWGCFRCAERCETDPASCACIEVPKEGSAECQKQQVPAIIKKTGPATWSGTIILRLWSSALDAERTKAVGSEIEVKAFDLVIKKR